MDFFGHEDRRRRRSRWLVVAFVLSTLLLVLTIDAAAFGISNLASSRRASRTLDEALPLLAGVTLVVVGIVAIASTMRTRALARGGGAGVALALGGRLVRPERAAADEQVLLDVVEEMSLASGVPVPQFFVLEKERSINAFAAGLTQGDAVITVTRGALDSLTRDELQGVVAHEFSHVLNGDMRMDLRLIGLVYGLLVIGITGRVILLSLRYVRGGGRKGGGVIAVIALVGLTLFVLGYVGYAAGQLIKAAVNRQREYLADASAVEFTRNPEGLSGALRKIRQRGSRIHNHNAAEMSHLFIASGIGGLLASHPPLEARLDAIDPGWRSRPEPAPRRPQPAPPAPARGAPGRGVLPGGGLAVPVMLGAVGNLGATTPEAGRVARSALPEPLRVAVADPFAARAVVLAALAERDADAGGRALAELKSHAGGPLVEEALQLHGAIASLDPETALSAVLLAIPSLRSMSDAQQDEFLKVLHALVESDGVVTLREQALSELVALHLGRIRPVRRRPSAASIRGATARLLALVARSEAPDEAAAATAFEAGRSAAHVEDRMPPPEADPRQALHDALRFCRAALPVVRRQIVEGLGWVVASDGVVSPTEQVVLRLVADALDCPLPRVSPTPSA
jgi:Zn-dependent protease with chaperone function